MINACLPLQVIYTKNCGADSVCVADLQLQAWPIFGADADETQLLIDDSPMFEVDVHISNAGELAYLTYVIMSYPDTIKFSRVRLLQGNSAITCLPPMSPNTTGSLECDLVSPIVSDVEVVFRLRFFAAALPFNMKSFNVSLEVKTASDEALDKLDDNFVNVTVPVEIRSLVTLHRYYCLTFSVLKLAELSQIRTKFRELQTKTVIFVNCNKHCLRNLSETVIVSFFEKEKQQLLNCQCH